MTQTPKIILPGGAGLVGQNLVAQFKRHGYLANVRLESSQAELGI
jgi:hypothetical protein